MTVLLASCVAQPIPTAPKAKTPPVNNPTFTPTFTPTTTAVFTFTPTPTRTITSTVILTNTPTVTATITLTATGTITPVLTNTPTDTPTITPTPTVTNTPTATFTSTITSTITFTPTATNTPDMTVPTILSPGDVAVIGFTTKGTENDQFAFVLLRAVGVGTTINFSDMNWDGYEFSESDGGVIVWTADKAYPAGTIVQALDTANGGSSATTCYAVNIYSGGTTYTNVTGGSQATGYTFDASSPVSLVTVANTGGGLTGLSTKGDQVFTYQGSTALGAAAAGLTFISGFTYGSSWLTGTPTPVPNPTTDLTYYADNPSYSYLPPELTDTQNAMAVTLTYGLGGYYNCANGTIGTEVQLSALLNNQANWTLNMNSNDLPIPVLSCALTVQ